MGGDDTRSPNPAQPYLPNPLQRRDEGPRVEKQLQALMSDCGTHSSSRWRPGLCPGAGGSESLGESTTMMEAMRVCGRRRIMGERRGAPGGHGILGALLVQGLCSPITEMEKPGQHVGQVCRPSRTYYLVGCVTGLRTSLEHGVSPNVKWGRDE